MTQTSGNYRWRIILGIAAIVLAVVILAAMFFYRDVSNKKPEIPAPVQPAAENKPSPEPTAASVKLTLAQIAARARTWEPQFQTYAGKEAPEFSARDLDGKVHKLSDYKGRDVMLVFWAMWCGPCKEEIPSLIKLRQSMPEDKLAIIAISTDQMARDPIINNSMYDKLVARLKDFVAQWKINYTVVTMPSSTVSPYSRINSLPSAFFIAPDGTVKMATAGLVPLRDMEAILAAEK